MKCRPHAWRYLTTLPTGVVVQVCGNCSETRHWEGRRAVWPGCRHKRIRGQAECECCKKQVVMFAK